MSAAFPVPPEVERDGLHTQIQHRTQQAVACGALQPIATHATFIEQDGVRFLLRILANLTRKEVHTQARRAKDPNFNPFLPYDPDLWVCDLGATHVCLLNKFNVVDDHILIVTRDFEPQTDWLTPQDFAALAFCLSQIDGLGFYNGGTAAGASQPHKHLQLVPFPLLPVGEVLPIEAAIATVTAWETHLNAIAGLPFRHALLRFATPPTAEMLQAAYRQAILTLGFVTDVAEIQGSQTAAYNLLVTRQWLLVVPRKQDEWEGISVNSLGFAGTLFVKNIEQQQRLEQLGPLNLLKNVAMPR